MTDVLQQLAQALGPILEQQKGRQFGYSPLAYTEKHDTTGTPGNVYAHGPGGFLTYPGVDPTLFSSVMGSKSIINQLPATPSLYTNPTYYTITGVLDVSGSEMVAVCDNAPTAGLMKAGLITSVFGRYERATPLIDIGRLGQRIDRADPVDLRLANTPMQPGNPFGAMADPASMTGTDLLVNETAKKFWELSVAFNRLLAKQIWSGNPSTGNTASGGYKEMTGFQLLVNTGYIDAENAQSLPSLDSYLVNMNHTRIDANSSNTVAVVTDMYHQLKDRADRAGVNPVRWVIAMRSQLFYELTAIWPCSYLTFRCLSASTSTPEFINAQDAVRFRDEMRAGKYLLIDGEQVEVIVDDGIPESDGNSSGGNFPRGCFETSIYFIPMSIIGGQAVTYLEYFQYQNPSIQDALGGNMVLGKIDGAFLVWPRQTNMCVAWQARLEPRLVLRTPWLAGRIQNVVYCPIQHEREPFPTDPYFVNGGRTTRSGPSYHSLWAA